MENMHPLWPFILKSTAFLSTSFLSRTIPGYRGDESRGSCIDSDMLVHFPPLRDIFPHCMRNLHTKPVTGEGIPSPGWAVLQAINTCMALLGSEPGHVSFWVKTGNCVPSVRSTWTCELVAKCFELPRGERCNRNLKHKRKNLFHYSSTELPATCSLLRLIGLLSDQMLSNTGSVQAASSSLEQAERGWLRSPACYLEKFIIHQLKGCFVLPPTIILHTPLLSQLIKWCFCIWQVFYWAQLVLAWNVL